MRYYTKAIDLCVVPNNLLYVKRAYCIVELTRVLSKTGFEYARVQLDPSDPDAQRLIEAGASVSVDSGYISVQAESRPLEIRTLELLPLDR